MMSISVGCPTLPVSSVSAAFHLFCQTPMQCRMMLPSRFDLDPRALVTFPHSNRNTQPSRSMHRTEAD